MSPVLGTRRVTQPWLWAQRGLRAWLEGAPGGKQVRLYPVLWAWGHMGLLCTGTWRRELSRWFSGREFA